MHRGVSRWHPRISGDWRAACSWATLATAESTPMRSGPTATSRSEVCSGTRRRDQLRSTDCGPSSLATGRQTTVPRTPCSSPQVRTGNRTGSSDRSEPLIPTNLIEPFEPRHRAWGVRLRFPAHEANEAVHEEGFDISGGDASNLVISEAANEVVVHHAHRLHVGITNRRSHE